MKILSNLIPLTIIGLLLAGQYGYLNVADMWYTVYATLTSIGIIPIFIISMLLYVKVNTTSNLPKEPLPSLPINPIIYLTIPLNFLILSNANYIVIATLSVCSTILFLSVVQYTRKKIWENS